MNSQTQRIHSSSQLWGLCGPLLIACTLFIIQLRLAVFSWELPLVALCGMVICYKWRWRGVLIALAILMGVTVHLLLWSAEDWLWTTTLALSIAASFVLTALSLEEFHHAWGILLKELDHQRKSTAQSAENIQIAQSKFHAERLELISRLETVQKELAVSEQKKQSADRLIGFVRDELTVMHVQKDKLLQELFEVRQHMITSENSAKDVLESQRTLELLQQQVKARDHQIVELKGLYESALMEHRLARQHIDSDAFTIASLQKQLEQEAKKVDEVTTENIRLQAKYQTLQVSSSRQEEELRTQLKIVEDEKATIQTKHEELSSNLEELKAAHQATSLQETVLKTHCENFVSQLELSQEQLRELALNESQLKSECNYLQDELIKSQNICRAGTFQQNELQAQYDVLENYAQNLEEKHSVLAAQEVQLQQQCAALTNERESILQKFRSAEEQNKQLSSQVISLQQQGLQLTELQQQLQNSNDQLKSTQDLLNNTQDLLNNTHDQLESTQKQLSDFESLRSEHHQLVDEFIAQKNIYEEVQREKELLVAELQRIQNQCPVVEVSESTDDHNFREARRFEGLYQQLRHQFMQKSHTLHETRRDLFETQEKLMALQREIREAELVSDREIERDYGRILANNEKELTMVETQYQNEIDLLQDVISSLVNAKRSSGEATRIGK